MSLGSWPKTGHSFEALKLKDFQPRENTQQHRHELQNFPSISFFLPFTSLSFRGLPLAAFPFSSPPFPSNHTVRIRCSMHDVNVLHMCHDCSLPMLCIEQPIATI